MPHDANNRNPFNCKPCAGHEPDADACLQDETRLVIGGLGRGLVLHFDFGGPCSGFGRNRTRRHGPGTVAVRSWKRRCASRDATGSGPSTTFQSRPQRRIAIGETSPEVRRRRPGGRGTLRNRRYRAELRGAWRGVQHGAIALQQHLHRLGHLVLSVARPASRCRLPDASHTGCLPG